MRTVTVARLDGDGVGPEVMSAAARVLEATAPRFDLALTIVRGLIGQEALRRTGNAVPLETVQLSREADAVLLGPLRGSTGVPATAAALYIAQELHSWLGVYANLRPVRVLSSLVDASPYRSAVIAGVDVMVVRDASSGLFYGRPRGIEVRDGRREATNTMAYTDHEISRVARIAFESARTRRQGLVLADWGKLLETGRLWREVVQAIAPEYPDVAFRMLDVDTCVFELGTCPTQFDVILADIAVGDLLSVQAAALTGSFALHPSAFVCARGGGLYSPGHGTAPTLAGTGMANPTAAILAGAMLLDHALGMPRAAMAVRDAVERALMHGARPRDLLRDGEAPVGTEAFTDRVIAELERTSAG